MEATSTLNVVSDPQFDQIRAETVSAALNEVHLMLGIVGGGITILAIALAFIFAGSIREFRSEIREQIRTSVLASLQDSQFIRTTLEPLLREFVRKEYETRITDINSQISLLKDNLELQSFLDLAKEVGKSDSYSNQQRDELMKFVVLFKDREGILDRAAFREALELTLDSYAAAGVDHLMEQVEEIYSDLLPKYRGFVITYVEFYSRIVIGSSSLSDSPVDRLKYYIGRALSFRMMGLALRHDMLLRVKILRDNFDGTEDEFQTIVDNDKLIENFIKEDLVSLDSREASYIIQSLIDTADLNIQSAQVRRIVSCSNFLLNCAHVKPFVVEFQKMIAEGSDGL